MVLRASAGHMGSVALHLAHLFSGEVVELYFGIIESLNFILILPTVIIQKYGSRTSIWKNSLDSTEYLNVHQYTNS